MISLNHRFAFVHVNKTGGTSVIEALNQFEDPLHPDYDHANAKRLKRLIGAELWSEIYSFAFVRNPFDRMVSSYFYRQQVLEDTPESIPAKTKSFRDWMLEDIKNSEYRSEWNDQLTMIEEGHGNIIVDQVFFFEHGLEKGLKSACDRIGIETPPLPHTNKTKKKHWKDYYDEQTIEVVKERFCRDIEWHDRENFGVWKIP